jgi:hypothetical protein
VVSDLALVSETTWGKKVATRWATSVESGWRSAWASACRKSAFVGASD